MSNREALKRLVSSARKAHAAPLPTPQTQAPFGFATRVAARWAKSRPYTDLWEKFCWAGATASLAVCLLAYAFNAMTPDPSAFDILLQAPVIEEFP